MNVEEKKNKYARLDESQEMVQDPEDRSTHLAREEQEKIFNWKKHKILNVLQIYSSPMRKIFLQVIENRSTTSRIMLISFRKQSTKKGFR
jgi:hypothetical protein